MEKPCIDNNQHSFWLLNQQNLHLTYYHPTYSSNLATQVVIGAFVQFLLKSRNPMLIMAKIWQVGLAFEAGSEEGAQEATPSCTGVEQLFQGIQQRREESTAVRRAQLRSLFGCVHQIFPSSIRENSLTPDSLKALAPKNGTIEDGEGTEIGKEAPTPFSPSTLLP